MKIYVTREISEGDINFWAGARLAERHPISDYGETIEASVAHVYCTTQNINPAHALGRVILANQKAFGVDVTLEDMPEINVNLEGKV